MIDKFKCPKCGQKHNIATLEIAELYHAALTGDKVEFYCQYCKTTLWIEPKATSWEFEFEYKEEEAGT